ncbi:MAG: primosomal protein N', partial [Phycisphaerales bacterium]|nr:primosomal protein N' [Phycisphaerales bacterium]
PPQLHGRPHLIGPTLRLALQGTLAAGGQAILLMNRRGYASYIACPSAACGWSMRCTECDASLVHHRLRPSAEHGGVGGGGEVAFVRCHHCLAEQRLERTCPICQRRLIGLGGGTQSVEDELEGALGLSRDRDLLRVDGDSMRSARDWFAALARFASGELRVLVGTQMISKGLDYPNVRLVGVVDADTAIALPDFRAAERTFQLVTQVAGRAGRGEHAGRVIVQTMNPRAEPIRFAAQHDYLGFATAELSTRRRAGLPPITRMARIVVRHEDLARADAMSAELAAALRAAAASIEGRQHVASAASARPPIRIDGPLPCPVSRIAGQYRMEVTITAAARGQVQEVLRIARQRGIAKSDARMAIDVDPIALM